MKPDASLLVPIPRSKGRATIGWTEPVPFYGKDYWNAYEFSFLDEKGIPKVAILTIEYSSDSPYLIESKSLKLYLNSYSMSYFENIDAAISRISNDLSDILQTEVSIFAEDARRFSHVFTITSEFSCIDELVATHVDSYDYTPELLRAVETNTPEYLLYSNLLKSNCPLTNQPDWGSVYLYIVPETGMITKDSLLQYIISYRNHQEYHEECCERMLHDIVKMIEPRKVAVLCKYTRRGGIDINPLRLFPRDFTIYQLPDNFIQLIYTRDFRQ